MKLTLALVLSSATGTVGLPTKEAACAAQQQSHGCSTFCGFQGVLAGKEYVCMPTNGQAADFPFPITDEDREEYCAMVAGSHGCDDVCGFKWDKQAGECRSQESVSDLPLENIPRGDAPIIGGNGKFRYQYMPDLLQAPAGASLVNCHGLVTDKDNNIYLTYQNDNKTDSNCLIRWKPDGTGGEFMTGGGHALCDGTPHGLKITTEGQEQFLYHANNNQKLTKTKLDGSVLWQVNGLFGQDTNVYRPTWFATPPDSEYMYLCDGYGSNQVSCNGSECEQQLFKLFGEVFMLDVFLLCRLP